MDIDSRLLRYFVAVAEELSFSRAAIRLHISQPPLSYAIKQLEEALNAQLLLRNSRQVTLTPAGRALYKEAVFLLRRSADLHGLISRIDAGLQGQIKIGFVGSMLYRGLPDVLKQCQASYPAVEHALLELNSAEQIELVARGGIDIGFIHANPVPDDVQCAELSVEPFSLCVPRAHRLAGKQRVKLAELADEDFIFFSRAFSPVYYETLLAMCLDAGFLPKVKYESRHWLSVTSLVSQNMGVSLVPACLSRSGMSGIRFLSFRHRQKSVTSLIWSATPSSRIKDNHVALIRKAYARQAPADASVPASP
ncbi:LysR family transcriptional regulator [Allopusillimonas ginsengisoli]|uniref:LysR family transcriptional regulator n=1 Tax=Allopusillimonas ginsengisoli TaxID=453575 RepID=UPI001AD95657|nr:LysR family transcriptional regulator [Allopusillimonas ginsengisoli]